MSLEFTDLDLIRNAKIALVNPRHDVCKWFSEMHVCLAPICHHEPPMSTIWFPSTHSDGGLHLHFHWRMILPSDELCCVYSRLTDSVDTHTLIWNFANQVLFAQIIKFSVYSSLACPLFAIDLMIMKCDKLGGAVDDRCGQYWLPYRSDFIRQVITWSESICHKIRHQFCLSALVLLLADLMQKASEGIVQVVWYMSIKRVVDDRTHHIGPTNGHHANLAANNKTSSTHKWHIYIWWC